MAPLPQIYFPGTSRNFCSFKDCLKIKQIIFWAPNSPETRSQLPNAKCSPTPCFLWAFWPSTRPQADSRLSCYGNVFYSKPQAEDPRRGPELVSSIQSAAGRAVGGKSQERNSLKRWGTKAIQGALCPLAGRQQANHPQRISDPEGPGEEALMAKSDSPNVVGTKRDLQLPQYFG